MRKATIKNLGYSLAIAVITAAAFIFISAGEVSAQVKYKPGDRVECETTGTGKYWTKGVIMPFQKGDFPGGQEPDGSWYRFKADYNKVEYPCKPEFIRQIAAEETPQKQTKIEQPDMVRDEKKKTVDEGDFVECPVPQKQVAKGAAPNAELFKKIIRCRKGEKPIPDGYVEGAVGVEVSSIQIGASRPWSYSQDIGNSKPGAKVFPVKAMYTVKTYYKAATEVEEGWIRILNFYVNAFGEWQIGSEEPVKSPKTSRVPK